MKTTRAPYLWHLRLIASSTLVIAVLQIVSASGADTFRIELDYMVDSTHSHEPSTTVIDAVQQMFACQGHTLVIDVDDALPHHNVLRRDPNDCSSFFDYSGSADSFGALRATYYDHDGDAGWHYCIFAHQYEDSTCSTTTSSGLAETPGEFFVVTLGAFSGQTGTPFDQAATLAHEFGHNLSLTHCGILECSDPNDPWYVGPYVPDLPSIMSYRYQLAGVRTNLVCNSLTISEALFKEIDYSHGYMCNLYEPDLDETFGSGMFPTDWNCDGTFDTSVAQDINGTNAGWCGSTGNQTTNADKDEWDALYDPTFVPRSERPPPRVTSCITAEEWLAVQAEMGRASCPQPTLAVEDCLTGQNIYIAHNTLSEFGTCLFPYDSVQTAHDAAPDGSVFFILPGTYVESGVLLTRPGKYFCNIGTAVIR
jgi:hypothetical protein